MAFFLTLILWLAFFTLSQLLVPDPDLENARPATLNDFNFPTATEGRVLPLHWGTDLVKGPNVLWYGDLKAVPIEEEVKVSLFKKEKFVTGHQYYIGFQMGICHGPAILKAIYVGEEKVWSGTKSTDGTIEIDGGGVRGTFFFYTGTTTQSVNSYLSSHQSPCPAYRGTCYGVWQGGYVGNSTSIKPWAFEIQRIPNTLAPAYATVNTYDCNPMEIVYEIMTNTDWGYGYAATEIDTTDWATAAQTLHGEGNGMSFIMANQRNATEIIKEVERQIDGHFRIDPATGKWKVALIRDGYSTSGLKNADVTTIKELIDFNRGTWDGTINTVRIMFKRRANDYTEGYAQAHDSANINIQGRKVPAIYTYVGLRNDALANKLAWREIRAHSYPLAKVRFKGDRTFWNSYVGEVIMFTYEFKEFTVTDMPFRIIKLDYGNNENPEIMIDAVQDIFSWRAASFSDPDATSWSLPSRNLLPFPSGDQLAFELPYAMQRRTADPSTENRLWVAGISPGRAETGYEVLQRNGVTYPPSGNYYSCGNVGSFMWAGYTDGAIDQDDTQIDILTDVNISRFQSSVPSSEAGEYLINMFLIGDELILAPTVAEITGGLRFTNCLRGVCDTAQTTHTDTSKVYFFQLGGGIPGIVFLDDRYVQLKLLPYNDKGEKVSASDAGLTVLELQMMDRAIRPYPPTFMKWNTVQYPTTVDITSDVVVTFNRRDFRILNEQSQHATDASTINGDFPSNNNTKYRLKLWDGVTLKYTGAWNDSSASVTMELEKIFRYLNGLPTTLKLSLETKHTYSAEDYEALQAIYHTASVQSSSYDDDHWFGNCPYNTTCPNSWTAPVTGTYGFSIPAAIAGDIQAQVNSGGWSTIITAGLTTGNLVGVTADDTIEVRHLDNITSTPAEMLLTVTAPSGTEDAFAVLVFV